MRECVAELGANHTPAMRRVYGGGSQGLYVRVGQAYATLGRSSTSS
jgi:hypothetical protein